MGEGLGVRDMVTMNDKAGIFTGKRMMLKPDEKKALQTIGWLVSTFPEQLKQALIKNGYAMNGDNGLALRKKLIQGTLYMIKSGNKQFAQDVNLIIQGKRFSNFDPVSITAAFTLLGTLFGGGQQNDEDTTNEIIALQAEKEKQAQTRNMIIFGGLSLLSLIGIVVIVKVASKD